MALDFLGTGFAYPPTFDPATGGLKMAAGVDSVRASLARLFETDVEEEFFVPQYGCDLNRLVFQGDTDALRAMVDTEVRQAIRNWEPRIARIIDLQVLSGELTNQPNVLSISIAVQLIGEPTAHSLVFPFVVT